MAQTSNMKAVAISPLKHIYGVPLGTTTTLVGLRAGQHALLQAAPQGLHLGHVRHGHDAPPNLASQRLVLREEKCEIREILATLNII